MIGKIIGPIFRSKSKIIENLKKSKININKNYKQTAIDVLGNYGRIFAEYPHLKNFKNNKLKKFINVEGIENLKKLRMKTKVWYLYQALNNLNYQYVNRDIYKSCCIYRPLNNIF